MASKMLNEQGFQKHRSRLYGHRAKCRIQELGISNKSIQTHFPCLGVCFPCRHTWIGWAFKIFSWLCPYIKSRTKSKVTKFSHQNQPLNLNRGAVSTSTNESYMIEMKWNWLSIDGSVIILVGKVWGKTFSTWKRINTHIPLSCNLKCFYIMPKHAIYHVYILF